MAVHSGIEVACTCLFLLLVADSHPASAQDDDTAAGLLGSPGPSPEYTAASIVTNLWLGAFAVTSSVFGIIGLVVAWQWPNPRVLCYKTSYSDIPSNSVRSCCSLYSLNLGFCVFYLLVFVIMVVARDILRIVICLSLAVGHLAVVVVFRMRFKRFGRPERTYNTQAVAPSSRSAPSPTVLGPRQALGIPIYNIPMQTVVIGAPADGNANTSGNQQHSSSYWYDAACVPPQQHGGTFEVRHQEASAGGATAGMPAPYVAAGSMVAYPPQPPAYTEYASYPQQQPAAGTVVGLAVPITATVRSPEAAASLEGAWPGSVASSTPAGQVATMPSPQQTGNR